MTRGGLLVSALALSVWLWAVGPIDSDVLVRVPGPRADELARSSAPLPASAALARASAPAADRAQDAIPPAAGTAVAQDAAATTASPTPASPTNVTATDGAPSAVATRPAAQPVAAEPVPTVPAATSSPPAIADASAARRPSPHAARIAAAAPRRAASSATPRSEPRDAEQAVEPSSVDVAGTPIVPGTPIPVPRSAPVPVGAPVEPAALVPGAASPGNPPGLQLPPKSFYGIDAPVITAIGPPPGGWLTGAPSMSPLTFEHLPVAARAADNAAPIRVTHRAPRGDHRRSRAAGAPSASCLPANAARSAQPAPRGQRTSHAQPAPCPPPPMIVRRVEPDVRALAVALSTPDLRVEISQLGRPVVSR